MAGLIRRTRMAGSAGAKNPGSWNRYNYTAGDPVNRSGSGLCTEDAFGDWRDGKYETSFFEGSPTYSNPGVPCASDSTFSMALQVSGQPGLDGEAVFYDEVIAEPQPINGGEGTTSAAQLNQECHRSVSGYAAAYETQLTSFADKVISAYDWVDFSYAGFAAATSPAILGIGLAARGKSPDFVPKHVTSEMFQTS